MLCVYPPASASPAGTLPPASAADTLPPASSADTLPPASAADTLPPASAADTLSRGAGARKKVSPNAVTSTVTYSASDSTVNDLRRRRAYLFGNAAVHYDDMTLKADYIEIDFAKNELYASGVADSAGNLSGNPVFMQGGSQYHAREIKYNFATRKGKITHVITTQDEGFIHGEQIKKIGDEVAYLKKGKYTTCELENPHYEIDFSKAKLIQNDKIVIGPAYLSFGGVPTPLAIPFGFFPLEKGRHSGLVMPSFGESGSLGFYIQNLGLYFGLSDNFDLLLSGDLYTRGSWALKAASDYVYRYKCRGNVQLAYSSTCFGEKLIDSSFRRSNDFKIYWDHKQDVKSHPTTRFNAHIDIVSSTYSKYNLSSVSDYLSNQYTSSVNLSTSAGGVFFFDATMSYSQNTKTGHVNLKLPDISMSVVQFYPFRKKNKAGRLKWYDNVSMKWNSQLTGQVSAQDSMFLKPETWEEFQAGIRHTIPVVVPVKIAKVVNWNTTATLVERWYMQSYECDMTADTSDGIVTGHVNRHFRRGFKALHDLSLSSELTTKVFLMYSFKKGGLKAIRHVVSPRLDFTYSPNLSGSAMGTYFNPVTGKNVEYSYYEGAVFGMPSGRTAARLRLSFDNNIEIKVKSRKDTVTGTRKVPLFDNVNVSMNYDFAADSLNWSPLSVSGRSTLFRKLYFTFNFNFDPYCIGGGGTRVRRTEWEAGRRLMRMSSANFNLALNWRIDRSTFGPAAGKTGQGNSTGRQGGSRDNDWSLTLNYTFTYGMTDNIYYYMKRDTLRYGSNMVHTLNAVGELHLTKKWKLGFNTGYDFVNKDFSYTSVDVYRDMHCWEMSFSWIPFGYRKGWSFTVNVKSAVLKDVLKYNQHHDFRDNL